LFPYYKTNRMGCIVTSRSQERAFTQFSSSDRNRTFNLTIKKHIVKRLYRVHRCIESIIYNYERDRDQTCNQWMQYRSVYGLVQCLLCPHGQVNSYQKLSTRSIESIVSTLFAPDLHNKFTWKGHSIPPICLLIIER